MMEKKEENGSSPDGQNPAVLNQGRLSRSSDASVSGLVLNANANATTPFKVPTIVCIPQTVPISSPIFHPPTK